MNMVCPPTITAPTGSWARRSETSRAYVRPTHSATVRSDERVRPPRRAPGRSSTNPPKGTTYFRNFSIGNDLFTTIFTAQMGRGKIQWGAFTSSRWTNDMKK
jgi:hypothetical protein